MKLMSMVLGAAMLCPTTAVADDVDCPHVSKPQPRKPRPVPPKKKEHPPCNCVGKQGPPGPQGPPGEHNELTIVDQHKVINVYGGPTIALRLGVIGTLQGPHGDWAWGPALQLSQPLSDNYDLVFSAGLAAGNSNGWQSGHILQLAVSREIEGDKKGDGLALSVGLNSTHIRGSDDNGGIDGDYLVAVGGIVLHTKHLRLEVGPTLGGLRDDDESGTQFSFGVQGSAFVGWGW